MLLNLERTVEDRIRSHAAWLSRNWTQFLGHVNGNPAIGLSKSEFMGLASPPEHENVGGALVSEAQTKAIEATGKAVGSGVLALSEMANNALYLSGLVVGNALFFLTGLAWAIINPLITSAANDKARHKQSVQQAENTVARLDAFAAQEGVSIGAERFKIDLARGMVNAAQSPGQLDVVKAWALNQSTMFGVAKQAGDDSLFNLLLGNWKLQHSKEPDEAGEGTSEAAYEDPKIAKSDAGKTYEAGKSLLFVHQLKLALLNAGLLDQAAVTQIERRARDGMANGGAVHVVSELSGASLPVAISDPVAFGKAAMKHLGVFPDAGLKPDFVAPARRGNVRGRFTLHLCEVDGCAVLESVDVHAECIGPEREAFDRGQSTPNAHPGFDHVTWNWTP